MLLIVFWSGFIGECEAKIILFVELSESAAASDAP